VETAGHKPDPVRRDIPLARENVVPFERLVTLKRVAAALMMPSPARAFEERNASRRKDFRTDRPPTSLRSARQGKKPPPPDPRTRSLAVHDALALQPTGPVLA
jgi:hypothetical protein